MCACYQFAIALFYYSNKYINHFCDSTDLKIKYTLQSRLTFPLYALIFPK